MCKKAKCAFLRDNGFCLMHKAECAVLDPNGKCCDGAAKLDAFESWRQHGYMRLLKVKNSKGGECGSCLHPNRNQSYGNNVFMACKRKTRYTTFERAREVAVHIEHKDNLVLAVYECPFCHGYHLTRQLRRTLRWKGNSNFEMSA